MSICEECEVETTKLRIVDGKYVCESCAKQMGIDHDEFGEDYVDSPEE